MNRLAIIPARGGSKRIPRKNIRPFLGIPIIAYSIRAALQSGLFTEVMVSTDDKEIAGIAQEYGASIPFLRSGKNADDHATTIDVIAEVIETYKKKGLEFEEAACIYPSAPFVSSERLINFQEERAKKDLDCVFPVLKYSYPIQRALELDDFGRMKMVNPEHLITRSQDLENRYHDAGQFYFFKVSALISEHKLWTKNTGAIVIPEIFAQDIDHEEDWELAEFKYSFLKKKALI
jgi:pseudaminic acid cytidylyltransferase